MCNAFYDKMRFLQTVTNKYYMVFQNSLADNVTS